MMVRFCGDQGRRAVTLLTCRAAILINLHQHGVINRSAEDLFHRSKVWAVSIRCELDAPLQARGQVFNKGFCILSTSASHQPGDAELGVGINRRPCLGVAIPENALIFRGYVLLLRVAEGPNFIALHPLALDSTDRLVLVGEAGSAGIYKGLCDRVDGYIRNPRGCPHGAAFHQQVQDLRSLLDGQAVHGSLQALSSY